MRAVRVTHTKLQDNRRHNHWFHEAGYDLVSSMQTWSPEFEWNLETECPVPLRVTKTNANVPWPPESTRIPHSPSLLAASVSCTVPSGIQGAATNAHLFLEHKAQLSYVSWRGEAEPVDFSPSSGGVTLGQDKSWGWGEWWWLSSQKVEIHLSLFCAQWH